MTFQPDWRNFEAVVRNQRPQRLPLYEHIISPHSMERACGRKFSGLIDGSGPADFKEYFRNACAFFREMTYDTVSYEISVCEFFPGHGAIGGGMAGPIQTRADFEKYPWDDVPRRYWEYARPRFEALVAMLPPDMKAVGGVGNGVFELAEDLVGLELLPFMEADDPELYADVFRKIGDLMMAIWSEFLPRYKDAYVACRFGDDLGFKTSLLTNPRTVRQNIIPQYRRVIDLVHSHGKPFLYHSCGCIFEVMEDLLALGIDAKHSNEDAIAPFERWIERYGDRIGLVGGFDMDFLCQQTPDQVFAAVVEKGGKFRRMARGYALGSGNSIPDYIPTENYLAMVRGAQRIRELERS